MKIIITERQYELLEKEEKILKIPFEVFNNDWNKLQKFLERKGNPLYSLIGYLDLYKTSIKSLGNLQSVGGYLDLRNTQIKSLGNLQSVGGDLYLNNTPISKKYSIEEIRQMVEVGGSIYL